jgi:hypothetical protein
MGVGTCHRVVCFRVDFQRLQRLVSFEPRSGKMSFQRPASTTELLLVKRLPAILWRCTYANLSCHTGLNESHARSILANSVSPNPGRTCTSIAYREFTAAGFERHDTSECHLQQHQACTLLCQLGGRQSVTSHIISSFSSDEGPAQSFRIDSRLHRILQHDHLCRHWCRCGKITTYAAAQRVGHNRTPFSSYF